MIFQIKPGGEPNDSLLIESGEQIKKYIQNKRKAAIYMCCCYIFFVKFYKNGLIVYYYQNIFLPKFQKVTFF